jgi:DNA-binding LytR/AlgR family response regulator
LSSALIVDDEPLLRDHLRASLRDVWPELERIDEAANGVEAMSLIEGGLAPDVCFLDIHMPALSGLDVARQLRALHLDEGVRVPQIVFVTAYDAHAIEAFEHGAIDYLLKPFEQDRLAETVARLKERMSHGRTASPLTSHESDALARLAERLAHLAPPRQPLQWIKASIGSTVRLIPVDDVQYFHADDKYTRVVTADGEALIRKPIKELVAELDTGRFWQIHRATIVNTRAIAGVVRGLKDSADLKLRGRPETLTVSRAYLHLFRQM